MPENVTLYRFGLSTVGAVWTGALGLLVGAAWGVALGVDVLVAAIALAVIAAAWGALVVHMTPTGGVIMENRTTVNYAVFALHAWYAVFLCIIALIVLGIRSLAA